MSPVDDPALRNRIVAAVAGVQGNSQLNALRFPASLTWSDGTVARASVVDPNRTDAGARLAQRLTGLPDVLDIRLLYPHPQDTLPNETARTPWDGGTLTLVSWGQVDSITGQAMAVCRFTR